MTNKKLHNLVILASTYPRWQNDSVPAFVEEFAHNILGFFKSVNVIVPHYNKAAKKEIDSYGVLIRRFRYFWPSRQQNIAYGEFSKKGFYPIKVILYAISEAWSTLVTCHQKRPTIINAHWLIPQGFVAIIVKKLLGTKVVISVHGADVYTLNGKLMRKLKKYALKNADAVVCNSSATMKICNQIFSRKYEVIPMGTDIKRFADRSTKKPSNKRLELLFVGRLVEEKGVMYILEAIKDIHGNTPLHLNVVGKGRLGDQMARYIADNGLEGVVDMLGWRSRKEIFDLYAGADVFVGPSIEHSNGWQEAFGVVFVEAAAAGLPIITTDTGGISDIVQSGRNGLVVRQKDSHAIACAIRALYKDNELRNRLGKSGKDYVSARFSWEAVSDRYASVFENI